MAHPLELTLPTFNHTRHQRELENAQRANGNQLEEKLLPAMEMLPVSDRWFRIIYRLKQFDDSNHWIVQGQDLGNRVLIARDN